jgi:hypothetical protein
MTALALITVLISLIVFAECIDVKPDEPEGPWPARLREEARELPPRGCSIERQPFPEEVA